MDNLLYSSYKFRKLIQRPTKSMKFHEILQIPTFPESKQTKELDKTARSKFKFKRDLKPVGKIARPKPIRTCRFRKL
jgi:hypothetical protein